ncbi:MAG: hypothetical protein K940chlam6_00712 [Chlamydiae bacterium]|nr:hypothetical protein [Chlamydiota bacterium]
MVAKKNLLGMKFGSLTVIQEAESNKDGRARWVCQCQCGEKRIATGKDLGKKVTRCPKKCILTNDFSGQRIGNMLVLKQEGSDKHGFRRYRCRCVTPLRDLQDNRLPTEKISKSGYCNTEILINAVGLKQSLKAQNQRKVPKSCLKCSRILWGKIWRESNPMEDLTGQTFGRLTTVKRMIQVSGTERLTKRTVYKCTCSCDSGIESYVRHEALIGKSVKPVRSCGCLQREKARKNKSNLVHGLSKHRLYSIRGGMINRCYNKNNWAFDRYGGRGIEICDAWLADFMTFFNWAIKQGWGPGLTIDRIDNDGPYAPDNCQFLTRSENALKMHRHYKSGFTIKKQQININQLSKKARVSADLCKKLLLNGYEIEDVFKYGQLELHQKIAVSRSIHSGHPITISEASYAKRVAPIRPPQPSEIGSYRAMLSRCYNPKDPSYRYYGAKKITVCPEWRSDRAKFLEDMGIKPEPKSKHVLDRIDPKKEYSPSNCRWIHISENSRRIVRKKKKEDQSNINLSEIKSDK